MIKYILKNTKNSKLILAGLFVSITSFEGIVISHIITQGSSFVFATKTHRIIEYLALSLGGWVVVYVSLYIYEILVSSIIKDLNIQIKNQFLKHSLINTNSAENEVMSFITNDLKMLETTYFNSLFKVILMGITAIVSIVAMLLINLPVSLVFIALSYIPNLVSKLFKSKIEIKSKEWSKGNEKSMKVVSDIIGGRNVLRVYSSEPNFYNKLKEVVINSETLNMRMNNYNQLANLFIYITSGFSFIVPFVIGIYLSTRYGFYSVSTLVSLFMLNDRVVGPLRNINQFITLFQKTAHVRKRILKVNDQQANFQKKEVYEVSPGLKIENLTLKYDTKIVLNKLNFEWKPGEKVLILGDSGSGKTSLINILTGSITATEGDFYLTDSNGKKIIRRKNGFFNLVEQNPHIFDAELRTNISLDDSAETEIDGILKITFLSEFTPDHYCEKDGKNLSGGQIQRIEISRALYQNNPIYFIDEMTASLNKEMGDAIRNYILSLPNMVIEIAHHYDEQVLKKYSKVYEIKNGRLNLLRSS